MKNLMLPFVLILVCLPAPIVAGNWPQFRGPGSRGVAEGTELPASWSNTRNVLWKIGIPGKGWSSPVVWEDRIFVTTVVSDGQTEEPRKGLYFGGNRTDIPTDTHHWMVFCIDLESGRTLWKRQAHEGRPLSSHHLKNSFASETPVTDGERVYAYFGNPGLFCYDMKGELVWSRLWKPAKTRYDWGTAASPVLHQDCLYIVNDNDDQSFIVALDKRTGDQLWHVDREEGSNWSTPFVWENDLRTEIVTSGTNKVRSYSLDGDLIWQFGGMSSITVPTPFSESGLLYISSGYVGDQLRPVYAVRAGASGDLSLTQNETANEHIVWSSNQAGPYNPSPLVYGEYYHTLLDRGFLTCHKARTGELVYGKRRIERGAGAFTASPWAYDDMLFCLSEDGDTFVIKAGPKFQVIGKNSLGEMCMATPAITQDSLIIRTASKLYRIVRLDASRDN